MNTVSQAERKAGHFYPPGSLDYLGLASHLRGHQSDPKQVMADLSRTMTAESTENWSMPPLWVLMVIFFSSLFPHLGGFLLSKHFLPVSFMLSHHPLDLWLLHLSQSYQITVQDLYSRRMHDGPSSPADICLYSRPGSLSSSNCSLISCGSTTPCRCTWSGWG